MHSRNISKTKNFAVCIAAIVLLSALLFSAFFIAAETGHDCSGEDCPICVVLEQCENTLHQMNGGLTAVIALILPITFFLPAYSLFVCDQSSKTPVSNKVRLNN